MVFISLAVQKEETAVSNGDQLKGWSFWWGQGWCCSEHGLRRRQREGERSPESKSGRKAEWERLEMEDGQHMAIILKGVELKCCARCTEDAYRDTNQGCFYTA